MIQSFRCKETEKVFKQKVSRKLPASIQRTALKKLLILDAASDLNDLKVPPGNRLEQLKGDREGQYSIRINQQFRVCFKWRVHGPYEVEIVDYH